MSKVSVLLPVYNGAKTLSETLDSILNQDFEDFEILISDDCSQDNSREILNEYQKKHSKIKTYFFETPKGLAASLNFLAGKAEASFLMRIDQDDICLTQRMRKQFEFLSLNEHVAVVGSFALHMGKTPEFDHLIQLPIESEKIKLILRDYNCMYHPATMIRKAALLSIGGYREEFKNAEDYDLWLRLSRKYDLYNLPEPLIRYRFSTGGMTLSRKWEQLYYVNLAKISDQFPDKSLDSIQGLAREAHHKMGKKYFLEIVYRGTIEELIVLNFKKDACKMLFKVYREVGKIEACRLAYKILKNNFIKLNI